MEKQKLFSNEGNRIEIPQAWNSIFGMGIQGSELNCTSVQLPNCLFNSNSDNSIDNQRDLFESALSSIVSSPVNSNAGISIPGSGESIVLRELIGRLGIICNSGEISPQSCINVNNSTTNSCYNTPLNSPPKQKIQVNSPIPGNHQLPLTQFPADSGFVERATRLSTFGNKIEFSHVMESGKLSRVSSNQSFKTAGPQFIRIPKELGDSMEESSVSETETGMKGGQCSNTNTNTNSNNTNGRKRKGMMIPKGKGKETQSSITTTTTISAKDVKVVAEVEKEESDAKRSKSNEEDKKGNEKAAEAPKDYIHVRARRGQATDSHSLAERVRREKISERMKFLQDLVPGCNKVTGKAVMLDEIINYVQSLQRQVEFLSMKLATVNPRMDVSMEALFSKDMLRPRVSVPASMNPFDASIQQFPYGFQSQNNSVVSDGPENPFSINPLTGVIHHNSIIKPSHIDGFGEASAFWENDLQSVVKMALGQDLSQGFFGQMKVEL